MIISCIQTCLVQKYTEIDDYNIGDLVHFNNCRFSENNGKYIIEYQFVAVKVLRLITSDGEAITNLIDEPSSTCQISRPPGTVVNIDARSQSHGTLIDVNANNMLDGEIVYIKSND